MYTINAPTIILDIDGTLIKWGTHNPEDNLPAEVLSGVHEKLSEWKSIGCKIILMTAREESWREYTTKQLKDAGISYNQLIMGVGDGPRIIINDTKPLAGMDKTCKAITVKRDSGLSDCDLQPFC